MSINRTLPKSINSRFTALKEAKQKKDAVAPANNALTTATSTRLDVIVTLFSESRNTVSIKIAESILATNQKETLQAAEAMQNSHYVQVLNMHIAQGIYPASYRAYYKINANSAVVPSQKKEAEVVALAQAIVDGEPNMIAAGGAAIPFPTLANIAAGLAALTAKQIEQSNKKDATDQAQEAIDLLNLEADAVIKKVWDEVETFWNEQPAESLRKKAREWGVVYISDAQKTSITATVKDKADGTAIDAATVKIISSDENTTTDAIGTFALKTGSEDAQTIQIEKTGYTTKEINITVVLGLPMDLGVVEMEKV
jgi:hypothetical protein